MRWSNSCPSFQHRMPLHAWSDLEATGKDRGCDEAGSLWHREAKVTVKIVKCGRAMWTCFKALDWRSIIHSFKAGLALGLVTCGVLVQPIYERLGKNVLWAVLTVVVVFECTVGATFSKGLNRGLGTFLAASIALLFNYLARISGPASEPYVIGSSICVVGMVTTYARFFPTIKAKYDYGMGMFLLTFCLVVVSGYRGSDGIDIALDRMLSVFLGCLVCVVISVFVCPVWAGDDLHNLIINNLDDLADALEGCTNAYFQPNNDVETKQGRFQNHEGEPSSDPIYEGYRAVLSSKQAEEGLANQARWEPWHGRFGCMYPWQRCLQVGEILRHCAYSVCALHGCVVSEIQAPLALRQAFSQPCTRISSEVVRVLRQLAAGLRECRKTRRSKQSMLRGLHSAVLHLQACMESVPSSAAEKLGGAKGSSTHNPSRELKRLFSATLLQPPYCLPDLHYGRASSVCVISDDEGLQQCREFVECLSVTAVPTLLIEMVSRLEPLLTALEALQDEACFKHPDAPPAPPLRRPNLKRYTTEKLILQHATPHIHPL